MPYSATTKEQTEPVIDILADLILGNPIALLDFAFELVATAIDRGKVIVGEIAPLLFSRVP